MPAHSPIDGYLEKQAEVAKNRQVAADEKAKLTKFITHWSERLTRNRKHDKKDRIRWADDRRVARGETKWLVDANLIGAIMEVLAAFLYAKNPDISASPSASVSRMRIPEYRKVAETLQIMVSRLLKNAKLKRHARKWVRASMTVGIGWLKASIKTSMEPNVMVQNQLNDLQQQRDRLEALQIREASEGSDGHGNEILKSEIDAQIVALESNREVLVAEGAVLDVYAAEDVLVAPECGDIENYLDAPYIAFDMYKTIDEAHEITGWTEKEDLDLLKTANRWLKRPRKGEDEDKESGGGSQWTVWSQESGGKDESEFANGALRFTEIWSKKDGIVFTMIDGILSKWAREPFAPITGLRWYPVFDLPCHIIDGERYPQSDVYQLKRLQDEYGSTRSKFSEHRKRAVPGMIFDMGAVTEESVTRMANSKVQEYIGVEMVTAGADIRTAFVEKKYNPIDPALYDTSKITTEMEKISGAQDAIQSSVQVEKTATEAEIMEAGRGARSGVRKSIMEDSLTELAEYMAQLCLQVMDQADAIKYAGPEAVWVEMTTEEALMLFDIEIVAGSTGKPKAKSDRIIWSTLMPLIEKMIDRIGQARMMGQEWAAKPWIALLRETMLRIDDPSAIEDFLPVPPPEEASPEDAEPSEIEQAEIEQKKSSAFKDRATGIEKMSELMTIEEAANFLFNGAKYVPNERGPSQRQEILPEGPNPIA